MNAFVRMLASVSRRAPAAVIVVVVLLTAVFGVLSGQQEMDQSQESFSPDNPRLDASTFASSAFQGSSDTIVQIVIEGDDVISPDGLETTQAVQAAVLGALPGDQFASNGQTPPVLSYLLSLEQAAAAGELPPPVLADDGAFDQAYEQSLSQLPEEFAGQVRQLVAGGAEAGLDPQDALMLVFLNTDAIIGDAEPGSEEATTAQVAAVRSLVDAVEAADTPLDASAFAFELFFDDDGSFTSEIGRLFGTAALIIVVILFLVYLFPPRGNVGRGATIRRALADVGLTLFAILASITWMQGIGVLLGPDYLGVIGAFSPPTQIIPILLIGLGVDYAIHLTSRYREELATGADVDTAIGTAVGTVGIALLLATLTTALGFLTNLVNPVPAIADFGILAAVGITVAFLLMLTFVPSVRILLDRRADAAGRLPREALGATSEGRLSTVTASTSILAERFPAVVLSITVVLGALGAYGLTQLSTEFSFADFVPADNPVRTTFLTLEEEFTGGFGERSQLVIQGEVATPAVHNATVAGQQALAGTEGVITFADQAAAQSVVSVMAQQLLLAQAGTADPGADPGTGAEGAQGGDSAQPEPRDRRPWSSTPRWSPPQASSPRPRPRPA